MPGHLTAFCAWDSSPNFQVIPAQLTRLNVPCVMDDFAYVWVCVAKIRNTQYFWTIMKWNTLLWIKNTVMWFSVMLEIKQYSLNNHKLNDIAVNKKCSYVVLCNACLKSNSINLVLCGTAFGYLSGATFLVHFTADLGYRWVWISLPRISHLPIMWTTLLCR